MTISNQLYYAILAMDAYNRGQAGSDSRALFIPNDNGGGQVGNAARLDQNAAPLPNGYQNAGFFATAYDLNGETVISFRGTDPTTVNAELFKDIFERRVGFLQPREITLANTSFGSLESATEISISNV